jgi:hypothetical protein
MLEYKINGKEVPFKFGIKFLREADKQFSYEADGMTFGYGVLAYDQMLQQNDPEMLVRALLAANKAAEKVATKRIKEDTLEEWLDGEYDDSPDFIQVVADVLQEIREGAVTGPKLKTLKKLGNVEQ